MSEAVQTVTQGKAGRAARVPVSARQLAALRPFKPGQSGNPGGSYRARFDTVVRLAREKSIPAVKALAKILEDPNEDGRVRVVAAEAILNRAWGKREPTLNDEPQVRLNLKALTTEELRFFLRLVERGIVQLPAEQQSEAEQTVIEGTALPEPRPPDQTTV